LGQFTLNKPRSGLWKSVYWSKPGYTSIICSTISNIPYNLIFTTKFNDSSILFTITSCDYLNLSFANEHVGDVTIPTRFLSITKIFSRRISQSACSIQIKLNYFNKENSLFHTILKWFSTYFGSIQIFCTIRLVDLRTKPGTAMQCKTKDSSCSSGYLGGIVLLNLWSVLFLLQT
jgi:hypothetical protein